jgi:hypothetical protein
MTCADVKTTMMFYTQTVPSHTWKERESPLDMDTTQPLTVSA